MQLTVFSLFLLTTQAFGLIEVDLSKRDKRQTGNDCPAVTACQGSLNPAELEHSDAKVVCQKLNDVMKCSYVAAQNCSASVQRGLKSAQQPLDIFCGQNASLGCMNAVECALGMVKYVNAKNVHTNDMCHDLTTYVRCLSSHETSCPLLKDSGYLSQQQEATRYVCSQTSSEPCTTEHVTKCTFNREAWSKGVDATCREIKQYVGCLESLPTSCGASSVIAQLRQLVPGYCKNVH